MPTLSDRIFSLPFFDGFEIDSNWVAYGSWSTIARSQDGQGWYPQADGTVLHTLELDGWLDLTGATRPILSFRHTRDINPGDMIGIDILPQGATDWQIASTHSNVNSGWEEQRINLSQYSGQLIRFRLGPVSADSISQWGIDSARLADYPLSSVPTAIPPLPTSASSWYWTTPPTTKVGRP